MTQPPPPPRILPSGDTGLTVEFGEEIDPALNARVLELDRAAAALPGIVETIPTYRSLLVRYDPALVSYDDLGAQLVDLARDLKGEDRAGTIWDIPVCYGGEYGIDLEATAATHDLTPDELVRRHMAPTYRVYMLGFLPGFAYLGGLDPSIATSRRVSPRLQTPAGTISIGGIQALVASLAAPSGWHLLGRTPVRNFMPTREPAVIIQPGDGVRFRRIDEADFIRLDREAEAGQLVAEAVS
ncbi:5-oxoprolinase subunit PxpB [Enterovirga rhinocerotis]|uniref:KipI family sensor histidine kinase inhibitor n=1 Tax=Enterovirga rhinocerotis TaxID=1339210 RepID=A0A4R7C4C3_9HYPH|nr:5-oxoprolinase subunit PxpB [Enterovirga rhinocerotis]TDR93238.1 KipI family sensor histidine kinase inhibitor [Enterovirga rhinocerotis]